MFCDAGDVLRPAIRRRVAEPIFVHRSSKSRPTGDARIGERASMCESDARIVRRSIVEFQQQRPRFERRVAAAGEAQAKSEART